MAAPSPGKQAWTPQQDKLFERALALYDDSSPSRWEQVASMVPGKDASQVRKHYELLVEDVNCIEAGRISLPRYNSVSFRDGYGEQAAMGGDVFAVKRASGLYPGQVPSSFGKGSAKAADQERKKGIPWTEEEHKLFLLGLEKFGKGDWRSISRNFVVSRTPTQVASHAQKYFIRLNSINKDKRRSSIHDITSIGNNQQASASVSSSPPPPTSSSSSSMAAEAAPPCSLLRPPLYIPPAVVEQPMSSPLPSPIAPQPILLPSSPPHLVRPALPASPLPISPSPHPRPTHMAFSLPQTAMHQ